MKNQDQKLIAVSKFLSLVLRHQPQSIGLVLDEAGWVDVDQLLARAATARQPLTRKLLEEVVATSDKQRFAFSADGQRIRANQGHSVPIDLGLQPVVPPATLFHGTASRFLPSIQANGLVRGNRHHVHLSENVKTARAVGGRHGEVVVLRIDAERMARDGHLFYRTDNDVWLADTVPVGYFERQA
jgi:putative RNA 2'-phosphotransferase